MKVSRTVLADMLGERSIGSTNLKEFGEEIAAYLLAEHRTAELSSLMRDLMQYRADHGIVEVLAYSAYPLSPASRNDIESNVQVTFPGVKKVIISEIIDADVVAGVRLESANEQLDLSARAQLNRFKQLTSAGKEN
jgi:F0F1-type ATP synthase delta subunit